MVAQQWILWLYHNYALVLGVTSHRWVSGGRLRQTWLTRSYATLVNVIQLLGLPYAFGITAQNMIKVNWFPNHIPSASYIFYSASYLSIAYTQISRGSRDKALLEVDLIVERFNRLKSRERIVPTERISGSLSYLFYMKLVTVTYLCVCSTISVMLMPSGHNLHTVCCTFFFSISWIIPLIAIYRYFLALWDIAYCYQFINGKLEHLMKSVRKRYPRKVELKELHRLWSLHALLGRCTLKFNRTYGLLMLTARLENLVFTAVNGYWGIVFTFSYKQPLSAILYGSFNYSMLVVDFFLLNFMCDLITQYQNYAYQSVSEVHWFKELNAYLLYANTSKMNLWVCGLYKMNRKCWYQMLLSSLNFVILLLQFHLLLGKKFTL